jgi:hypothetical protein
MRMKVMVSVSPEEYRFLKEHPELSPSGLLQKSISDYKQLYKEHLQKQEVEA